MSDLKADPTTLGSNNVFPGTVERSLLYRLAQCLTHATCCSVIDTLCPTSDYNRRCASNTGEKNNQMAALHYR